MISIQLEGGIELEKKLMALETKISKNVVQTAVRKAQNPMLSAAKSNARSMVGGEMGDKIAENLKILAPEKGQKKGTYELSVRFKKSSELWHYTMGSAFALAETVERHALYEKCGRYDPGPDHIRFGPGA